MADLAEPALRVVREKKIQIHPERYAKSYLDWLGEKRDWPVSRQLCGAIRFQYGMFPT